MPDTPRMEPEVDVVEADKVQQYLDEKLIGQRIRRLRLKHSMGLVDLGARTGLSASFLSQLETGRIVPTIRNLAKIALVFEKDLSWFFRREKSVSFRTLRRDDRVRLNLNVKGASRFVSESLSALIPDRRMVPCLAELIPGGERCDFVPRIFHGLEFIYVIEGTVCLWTPARSQELSLGDVAWIDASSKRQYTCTGDVRAKLMIVTFPQHQPTPEVALRQPAPAVSTSAE
jgi:transcriptional regulator with XRE-family HTH domain